MSLISATLEQVRNELERLYFSHGKYAVRVETTIEPLNNNRVDVAINIVEGQAARIKELISSVITVSAAAS